MASVLLYHFPPSFYSQIVRLTLEEKRVPWTSRMVDIGPAMENYEPWYIRLNPNAVIPTLEHQGKVVIESARIILYIDKTFDGPPLLPASPAALAEMEKWIRLQEQFPIREFTYGNVTGPAQSRFTQQSIQQRIEVLERKRQDNPDLYDTYTDKLNDIQRLQRDACDSVLAESLNHRIEDVLHQVEGTLQGGRRWIVGESYTLADVVWTVLFARLHLLGRSSLWESGKMPAIADYVTRTRARPSYNTADIWDQTKLG